MSLRFLIIAWSLLVVILAGTLVIISLGLWSSACIRSLVFLSFLCYCICSRGWCMLHKDYSKCKTSGMILYCSFMLQIITNYISNSGAMILAGSYKLPPFFKPVTRKLLEQEILFCQSLLFGKTSRKQQRDSGWRWKISCQTVSIKAKFTLWLENSSPKNPRHAWSREQFQAENRTTGKPTGTPPPMAEFGETTTCIEQYVF